MKSRGQFLGPDRKFPTGNGNGINQRWASFFRVSTQTIRNWTSRGFDPHADEDSAIGWVAENAPTQSLKREAGKNGSAANLRDEQTKQLTRKYRHEARLRKIEADIKCGKLVPVSLAASAVSAVAQATVSELQTMHLTFGADVVELRTVADGEAALRAIGVKLREKIEEAGANAVERFAAADDVEPGR